MLGDKSYGIYEIACLFFIVVVFFLMIGCMFYAIMLIGIRMYNGLSVFFLGNLSFMLNVVFVSFIEESINCRLFVLGFIF